MSKLARNVFIPTSYSVWTAPLGTALPTSPLTAPSAAYYEVGYLSDQGVTEGRDINETLIYDLVGQLVATARNQEARPFTFEALEDNRVVRELRYPNSTLATVAGTAEVQTITLTGTGTAGTWSLTLPGYGTASALTYNVTTSALATALNAAFGVSGITVSGTAGSSYVVTFPASMGNVALMIASNNITGVTAIGIVETTPGVPSINTRSVGSGTGQNHRVWLLYLAKGNVHKLFGINDGEATQSGTVGATGSGASISQFTLRPYPDVAGNFFYLIDDDPSQTVSYA